MKSTLYLFNLKYKQWKILCFKLDQIKVVYLQDFIVTGDWICIKMRVSFVSKFFVNMKIDDFII